MEEHQKRIPARGGIQGVTHSPRGVAKRGGALHKTKIESMDLTEQKSCLDETPKAHQSHELRASNYRSPKKKENVRLGQSLLAHTGAMISKEKRGVQG